MHRLKTGTCTHASLAYKSYKINVQTLALEAGKSRNCLYNTHKDILGIIEESKLEESVKIDKKKEDKVLILKNQIKLL